MATQTDDTKNPAAKPHGTTADQVHEMESEGQAQNLAPTDSTKEKRPNEPFKANTDQDIDTAGTEADDHR